MNKRDKKDLEATKEKLYQDLKTIETRMEELRNAYQQRLGALGEVNRQLERYAREHKPREGDKENGKPSTNRKI